MEAGNYTRNEQILICLSSIPKKIISLHGRENIPEFVLHELCHNSCFNINKAAYLVNNMDFNHLKGVAGYFFNECYPESTTMWEEPDTFSLFMKSSQFNQRVRNYNETCCKAGENCVPDEIVDGIGSELGINHPDYIAWKLKHDNVGILIFENGNPEFTTLKDHLKNSVYLFGFCPIF